MEEKPVDLGIDDVELEQNPLEGIEKPKWEGEREDEEEEAGELEEELEEEEPEPPKEEEGVVESGEAGAIEEGTEKAVESEDVKKLKQKKAENAKKAKKMKKQIKDLKNLLKRFDKVKMKTTLDLEKVGKEAKKYEKALQIADGWIDHQYFQGELPQTQLTTLITKSKLHHWPTLLHIGPMIKWNAHWFFQIFNTSCVLLQLGLKRPTPRSKHNHLPKISSKQHKLHLEL